MDPLLPTRTHSTTLTAMEVITTPIRMGVRTLMMARGVRFILLRRGKRNCMVGPRGVNSRRLREVATLNEVSFPVSFCEVMLMWDVRALGSLFSCWCLQIIITENRSIAWISG